MKPTVAHLEQVVANKIIQKNLQICVPYFHADLADFKRSK